MLFTAAPWPSRRVCSDDRGGGCDDEQPFAKKSASTRRQGPRCRPTTSCLKREGKTYVVGSNDSRQA
jgi:hypothetical protein